MEIPAQKAIVLAAGLGKRMRPLTENLPKPLLPVLQKPLLAYHLEGLSAYGVSEVIVNVHYLAQKIVTWLEAQSFPFSLVISDETDVLLETGGGIKKALPFLSKAPFFVLNSDQLVWPPEVLPQTFLHLLNFFDRTTMDGVLLLSSPARAFGYEGKGDFVKSPTGALKRREGKELGFIFTGYSLLSPTLFFGAPEGPFSLNWCFDRALEKGRLFGIEHVGPWFHIGTPKGLSDAEREIKQRY